MPTVQRKKPQQYTKESDPFYHSTAWRSMRRIVLTEEPLCYYCHMTGYVRPAHLVDHFRPRRLFPELSFVRINLRPSCNRCHNKKRVWERSIATREQFEREIGSCIEKLVG